MKEIETVIIGAGISGLACANRLNNAGKKFVVISKDIGGRIKSSKNNPQINLGGVYINKDYFNLMPFIDIIEPFRVRDFYFFDGSVYKNIFSFKNLKSFPKLLKFVILLWEFRKQLNMMRKDAEQEELKVVIENNPLLKKYWHMSATDFLRQHRFEELDHQFGQPTAGTNVFTTSKELNVFYYMYLFITMIRPAYIVDLSKTASRLSKGFETEFLIDTVISVEKNKAGKYIVTASRDEFISDNVVIAAPYLNMIGLCSVPEPARITSVFTYYVTGHRKSLYSGKKGVVLHPDHHDAYLLWQQKSGGDLIYAKTGDLDLSRYYDDFTIQDKVFWKTGMHLPSKSIFRQKLDTGLYLASDYNFSLMEDAFVTGLYAANQIINSQSYTNVFK